MLFRHRTTNDSGYGNATEQPQLANTTSGSGIANAAATASSSPPSRYQRPSSAPVPGAFLVDIGTSAPVRPIEVPFTTSLSNVEERLSIVKRSRSTGVASKANTGSASSFTAHDLGMANQGDNFSPGESPTRPLIRSYTPPCLAFPTFSKSKLLKHEQHVVDAMTNELLEVFFFAHDA